MTGVAVVRQLTSAAVVMTLLAGCTGTDPSRIVTQTPSPSPWIPELTEEEAFERMPLGGTDETPVYWEVSESADSTLNAAIRAAQANRALDYYRYTTGTPASQMFLYRWVTAEEAIGIADLWLFSEADPANDPGRGPVWMWVQVVEQSQSGTITVLICEDLGWWEQKSRQDQLPRSPQSNPIMTGFLVDKVSDAGVVRWKVTGAAIWHQTIPEYAEPCRDWATHEPEEER